MAWANPLVASRQARADPLPQRTQQYYSFQLGYFAHKTNAVRLYKKIASFPHPRLERNESFYTVRFGLWKERTEAERFRTVAKAVAPDALLKRVFWTAQEITSDSTQQQRSPQAPLATVAFAEPELPMGLGGAPAPPEPALPSGLGESPPAAEPELPTGLGGEPPSPEPLLPPGLGTSRLPASQAVSGQQTWRDSLPFELTGFVEVGAGVRTQNDPHEKLESLGESRLHVDLQRRFSWATLTLVSDFLADWVDTERHIDLELGRGWVDLREANAEFSPLDALDLKLGRQILTWGTGDLLFINDLFPKDWNAFFIGRDETYLKAPSDAIKASFFSPQLNIDLVYTPLFDADRFIDGRRVSYWNPLLGTRAGRNAVLIPNLPNAWFDDNEWAARLYRSFGPYEVALYGYYGFWKSPGGFDQQGRVTFPRLSVYGASVRGPVRQGIAHLEAGYMDSLNDRRGDDPLINNSEFRFLMGYEQEIGTDFSASGQYALEHMLEHTRFLATQSNPSRARDENRHLLTLRLTKLLLQQKLSLSFFTFFSPSDQDAYLRPWVQYKFTDAWSGTVGGNVFIGKGAHTFFGQFEKSTNAYTRLRYLF